jgi:predicted class III extradiol MEMO1 family dioxygenase
LSTSRQQFYGRIFANYIADPANLFVISSDFCHWGMPTTTTPYLFLINLSPLGQRFRYTPMEPASVRPVHEQIAALDQQVIFILTI